MFSTRVTKTIPVPVDLNDPGDTRVHEVTIQKLAGRHLGKAQQAFFNELVSGISERGGSRVQKDLEELWKKDPKEINDEVAKVQADPLNGCDPHTLILYGVKGWTYDRPIGALSFEELDEEAVTFYAREVLRLTKPSLFHTEEEAKAAQKETVADPSIA